MFVMCVKVLQLAQALTGWQHVEQIQALDNSSVAKAPLTE